MSAGRSPCPCAGFSENKVWQDTHTLEGSEVRPPGASTGIMAKSEFDPSGPKLNSAVSSFTKVSQSERRKKWTYAHVKRLSLDITALLDGSYR